MRLIVFFGFFAFVLLVIYWVDHAVSSYGFAVLNESTGGWDLKSEGWNIFLSPLIIGIAVFSLLIGVSGQGIILNLVHLANNYDKNDEIKAAKKRADEAEELAKDEAKRFVAIDKKDIAVQQAAIKKELKALSDTKELISKAEIELELSKQELIEDKEKLKKERKDFEFERDKLRRKSANAVQAYSRIKKKLERHSSAELIKLN